MNTQDGYDWPNGCTDERWPVEAAKVSEGQAFEDLIAELDKRSGRAQSNSWRVPVPYIGAA